MSIIDAIEKRVSCRTYDARPLEAGKKAGLIDILKVSTEAPFGGEIRFELLDLEQKEIGEIRSLGTYGVIKGATLFIAGVVRRRPKAMEDFGYCMEKVILEATALGLGTCWLGGTFNRAGFAEKLNPADDELLPAVTPVGYAGGKRSLLDRFLRFSAGSDRRRSWREIFFDGDIARPLTKECAGIFEVPLECLRLAPSATNKQPWRIVRQNDKFHFYLKPTPGYGNLLGEIKLQNIDMGIAMCHFELSAKETGCRGRWQRREPQINAAGMEYIASWAPI